MAITLLVLFSAITGHLLLWFIYHKHYRFASIIFDFLPYYTSLSLLFAFIATGSLLLLNLDLPLLIIIFIILAVSSLFQAIKLYKWSSNYKLNQYESILKKIKDDPKIEIIDVQSWIDNPISDPLKLQILIRHDVDIDLNRTKKMAEVEEKLGVPACYYFRFGAEKFTKDEALELMKDFDKKSNITVGFHYESLSRTNGDLEKAVRIFEVELNKIRQFVNIKFISAHGDKFDNKQLVRDGHLSLEKYGLLSSYQFSHDFYISEIGGNHYHNSPWGKMSFIEILNNLLEQQPGNLAQILVHADWWF